MTRIKGTLENEVRNSLDGQTFLDRLEESVQGKAFPWQVVSTRELATLFHVHLQTLHNWHVRGRGPEPEPKGKWKGNRRYYTVANVMAWLDDRPAWHVYREWYQNHFHTVPDLPRNEVKAKIDALISEGYYTQPLWKRNRRFRAEVSLGGTS